MLNILANEKIKLKRNKLMIACTLIGVFLPLVMIGSDISSSDFIIEKFTVIEWVNRLILPIQLIIYPVLSGFVITFLIQKEYMERTMINTLTAPTNRNKFLIGKFIIWATWFVFLTVLFLLIAYGGVSLLYGNSQLQKFLPEIIKTCLKAGILNLLSMTPILVICIFQKNVFYPSLLFSCIVAGIDFVGLYWSESIRRLVPWSAVTSVSLLNDSSSTAYLSILCCFLLGIGISLYSFNHQDL
ncbi:ABC transporter permease [Clostridium sp.]|uniref:ABC transporter permease n=1 Tax=Clostridium sp. TaxID=1506 RepID=UPI00258A453C|nr:ABC transporter permease [Clostridium sp.]MDF2505388.1 transporter multidrug-family permease [Clostridium sp.]